MRRIVIPAVLTIVVAVLGVSTMRTSPGPVELSGPRSSPAPVNGDDVRKETHFGPSAEPTVSQAGSRVEGAASSAGLSAIPYQQNLNQYLIIRNKVFMSETEKILRRSFLNHSQMLIALGDFLRTSSVDDGESDEARNVATDLLLEAVQKENSRVAARALQNVIEDDAIENDGMEVRARRALAGTKAEVLYQWSAFDPGVAAQVSDWLPGPVSQKIWKNVRQAQDQNLLESAAEEKN